MIDQPARLADFPEPGPTPAKGGSGVSGPTADPNLTQTTAVEGAQGTGGLPDATTAHLSSVQASPTPGPAEPKVVMLGEYRLLRKIGTGGMGVVYLARHAGLNQDVALKVLSKPLAADAGFLGRFQREARILARLDHPHIVRGLGIGSDRGYHYSAMEFVEGGSVQDWQKKLGKLAVGDVLHIGLVCARALQYAHEQDLVHRDIKPGNLLISRQGMVKLADLGLAKAIHDDPSLTASGVGMGTPYYMSPEQVQDAKHADHRSDIFSLGCTLYHLLAGQAPFAESTLADTAAGKRKHALPVRRLNMEVPERLDLILGKMMAPLPEHRYQSCAALIREVEALGLAHVRLGFLETSAGRITDAYIPPPPQTVVKSVVVTKAPRPPDEPTPRRADDLEWWYLRYPDAMGKMVTNKYSFTDVLDMIRERNFDAQVEASRSPEGGFRPLGTYREFESELRGRHRRKKTESRAAKFQKFYEIIDKDAKITKRRRWFQDLTRSFFGWVALVGIAAAASALCYGLYHFAGPFFSWIASKLGLADAP